MARDEGDVRAVKAARAEITRRGIDLTYADLRCMHGVVQIRGTVRTIRGSHIPDLKSEMELIGRVLRQKAEIRDVIIDCIYRT